MSRSRLLALAIATAIPLAVPAVAPGEGTTAEAAELKLNIRSEYPHRLYLEFYGQKHGHVWPGNGEVFVLKDSKYHTENPWCQAGDTTCYGAWVTTDENIYWGVGRDDTRPCKSCCLSCKNGSAGPITLVK